MLIDALISNMVPLFVTSRRALPRASLGFASMVCVPLIQWPRCRKSRCGDQQAMGKLLDQYRPPQVSTRKLSDSIMIRDILVGGKYEQPGFSLLVGTRDKLTFFARIIILLYKSPCRSLIKALD